MCHCAGICEERNTVGVCGVRIICVGLALFVSCKLYDMIYLLTAIGLSPGGSTHLHTNNTQNNTKTTEQHKYKLMWKSAGRAPSLRVLPWHVPYN